MRLLAFQLKEALVPAKSEGPYIVTANQSDHSGSNQNAPPWTTFSKWISVVVARVKWFMGGESRVFSAGGC